MTKANADVRAAMKVHRVPAWAIGTVLGIHENTVLRRLRTELPEPAKQELLNIIDKLSEQTTTNQN